MLKKLFASLLGQHKGTPDDSNVKTKADHKHVLALSDIPRYPPFDTGIPVIGIDLLLESQAELISKIRISCAMESTVFDRKVMQVIKNYASYVHLLPATKDSFHRGAGGLFRLGLEIGFYSLQATDGLIFSGRESPEKRNSLEPAWKYATLLAGLCSEVHRALTDILVVDEHGRQWPRYLQSLYGWSQEKDSERYFIRWINNGNSGTGEHAVSTFLVNTIIPSACLQELDSLSPKIVASMMAGITGTSQGGHDNLLAKTIQNVRMRVIQKDEQTSGDNYGKLTIGTHIEPHLIDAMKRLFKAGKWSVNQRKSRIWVSNEGAFLVWKTAASEIIDLLGKDKLPGIPQDSDTLAEMLVGAHVFVRNNKDNGIYWSIQVPNSSNVLTAVKLTNPSMLIPDDFKYEIIDTLTPAQGAHANQPQASAVVVSLFPSLHSTPNGDAPLETGAQHPREGQPNDTPAHVEGESDLECVAADLVRKLHNRSSQEAMKAIVEDFNSGSAGGGYVEGKGFAIPVEVLAGQGVDLNSIMADLFKAGWACPHPDKPKKKIQSVKIGPEAFEAIVLERRIAKGLGFMEKA